MNPSPTDYDLPDFNVKLCDLCHCEDEGGYVDGQWVCNWCHEEMANANFKEEEE